MININDILQENDRRKKAQDVPYNPVSGLGCCGTRIKLTIKDLPCPTLYLPIEMMNEPLVRLIKRRKTIKKLYEFSKEECEFEEFYKQFLIVFTEIRIKYDFEYFAVMYETILSGQLYVDFVLKKGQRKAVAILEKMRLNGEPIRAIILKARQLGLSTLIQMYMLWIQIILNKNWHSVICAHTLSSSQTIRAMYDIAISKLKPVNGQKIELKPFQGSQTIRYVPQRGCRITIGTAESPDSVRGQAPQMIHLSEVGMYPNTTLNSTADLIASIISPVKREPNTLIIYESTAKGVGNFFHNVWQQAKNGEINYEPIFLAWFYDETYKTEFNGKYYNHSGKLIKGTIEDFISSMIEYEINLFNREYECTLENLNWYRGKAAEMSTHLMRQEFPSNDIEAFQHSGLLAFNPDSVAALSKYCINPEFVGILRGDADTADAKFNVDSRKLVLQGIKFIEDKEAMQCLSDGDPRQLEKKMRNRLKIWQMPETTEDIAYRYVVAYDPQRGLSEGADFGVLTIIDRMPLIFGGVPEVVAEWRGRVDLDIQIWMAAQVAKFYNNALLVVEKNTYDSTQKAEDFSETIFEQIADYYSNIYTEDSPAEQIKTGKPRRYGFHTNRASKTAIIANYQSVLRELGYIEHSRIAIDEAMVYEQKKDGSYGAMDGCHDDVIMSRMIALYISYVKMPPPYIINKEKYHTQHDMIIAGGNIL